MVEKRAESLAGGVLRVPTGNHTGKEQASLFSPLSAIGAISL